MYEIAPHRFPASSTPFNFALVATSTTPISPCVQKFQFFPITWFYDERPIGGVWDSLGDLGTTFPPVYVTYCPPYYPYLGDDCPVRRSVLDVACSTAGANNLPTTVANLWSTFAGRAVKNWQGQSLCYFAPGMVAALNGTDVPGLLALRTGSCDAWKALFESCLNSHGVPDDNISKLKVIPSRAVFTNDVGFLIKDWSTQPPAKHPGAEYPWEIVSPVITGGFEMVTDPPRTDFGDLVSQPTIPGQSTQPPAEKVFGYHWLVQYAGTLYDPSYGCTYADLNGMEGQSTFGYSWGCGVVPGGFHADVRLSVGPAGGLKFQ